MLVLFSLFIDYVLFFLYSLYLLRVIYFLILYYIFVELEGVVLIFNIRIWVLIGVDEDVFFNYLGVGYVIFLVYKVLYIILRV